MAPRTDLVVVFPNNRPRAYGGLAGEIAAITPPVQSALIVAQARRQGLSATLLDADVCAQTPETVAETVAELRPALVSIATDHLNSGDVTKMAAALDTLGAIRRRGVETPVVLEGLVPSAYPARAIEEWGADFACRGEPWYAVPALAEQFVHGGTQLDWRPIPGIWGKKDGILTDGGRTTVVNPDLLPGVPLEDIPPARYRAHHWHCFGALHDRTPYACVYTSLGCPYACSYCGVNVVCGGSNYRVRSEIAVADELERLARHHAVRNVRILDNVFTLKPERIETLCAMIAKRDLGLNLWAYARVESIRSPEMLAQMKQAGVNWLAYGFESASEEVRRGVAKKTASCDVDRVIEWTRRAGIHIVANFIFGLPDDDQATMAQTLDMAKRHCFEWVNFYCATAYPGTPLYDDLMRQGIHMPDDWSAYSQYSPSFQPLPTRHLQPRDVLAFRDAAFEEYLHLGAYRRRIQDCFGTEAVAFLDRILAVRLVRDAIPGS